MKIPRQLKKYEKKLAKLQRQLAGKTKGSGNYQKKGKKQHYAMRK